MAAFWMAVKFFKNQASEINHVGGLGGSGGPGDFCKRCGAKPRTFWKGLRAPGAAQTPKMIDFRPFKKIKMPSQSTATSGLAQSRVKTSKADQTKPQTWSKGQSEPRLGHHRSPD